MTPGYRFGVPPSGGGAPAKTMITITFSMLENANVPPAKAGTPNHLAPYGVSASAGETKIQQGMKDLEGMLK
jgi:hypothetical protein